MGAEAVMRWKLSCGTGIAAELPELQASEMMEAAGLKITRCSFGRFVSQCQAHWAFSALPNSAVAAEHRFTDLYHFLHATCWLAHALMQMSIHRY